MKKQICLLIFFVITITSFAQTIFPGLSKAQKQQILNTKISVPLPTWIPKGFVVTNVLAKTGKSVKPENKVLTITYNKKLDNGSLEFEIAAGFEGLGDLPYEDGETIKSNVGSIYLFYEPFEEDMNGKKVKAVGFLMTEWFRINQLAFHVSSDAKSSTKNYRNTNSKISKAEIKKILQSMQVLK